MNKFKKGDRVVVKDMVHLFPSIYKVNKVYMDKDNNYVYTLLDTKAKGMFKPELKYLAQEDWLELINK